MSKVEMAYLQQCMDNLALVFEQLGIQNARFTEGKATIEIKNVPANKHLFHHLCQHVSNLCKEGLGIGEEELDPDFFL